MPVSAQTLCHYARQLRDIDAHNGYRSLLLISGSQHWGQTVLSALVEDFNQHVGSASEYLLLQSRRANKDALRRLGSERLMVVIDGWQHSAINDWLAAAGTLRAGGQLILLCPELDQWPEHFSSLRREKGMEQSDSLFIRRLSSHLFGNEGVRLITEQSALPQLPGINPKAWRAALPNPDQQQLIADIQTVLTGRNWRPLLLRADRGRGKTAALGLAAASLLMQQKTQAILLCSAHAEGIETAFSHCLNTLAGAERIGDSIRFGGAKLQFMTAESAVLQSPHDWPLVMVDEAAQLSPGLLEQFVERFPGLVFSSTAHGYEGSGRGFDTRFTKYLDRVRPQWRRAGLRSPLRWSDSDPLEALLNRSFILDAAADGPEKIPTAGGDASAAEYRWLEKRHLAEDEELLRQVFGLLLQAHYQTTPNDLQMLLDTDGRLLVAVLCGQVVGVCQVFSERCADSAVVDGVVAGHRRRPGNLVSQRLAQYSGDERFLTLLSWRVNRIAVSENIRRSGVGAGLIEALALQGRFEGVSFLSVSFAIDAATLSFWHKAGFTPQYLGSRVDSSSGSYSLMAVKALSDNFTAPLRMTWQQFSCDFPLALNAIYSRLRRQELQALLPMLSMQPMSKCDLLQLQRYQTGAVIFEQVYPVLWRFCLSENAVAMTPKGLAMLVEKILLCRSWAALCEGFGFSGRREAEQAVRAELSIVFVEE